MIGYDMMWYDMIRYDSIRFDSILFPKQLYAVGVLAVYLLLADVCAGCFRRCGDQLLCAGCGLGDGCVAPVYAKCSVISLSTEKHYGFGIFYFKSGLAPQMASGWVQRLPRWLPGGF